MNNDYPNNIFSSSSTMDSCTPGNSCSHPLGKHPQSGSAALNPLSSQYTLRLRLALSAKEAFYTRFAAITGQCAGVDTLLLMGDFSASAGADRIGSETCIGRHASRIRNRRIQMLVIFAKSHGLKVAQS